MNTHTHIYLLSLGSLVLCLSFLDLIYICIVSPDLSTPGADANSGGKFAYLFFGGGCFFK